jgi:xanthine dehydrogenase accessory factor
LTRSDSVIILTHQFQKDQEILNYLKGKDLMYLGVLGPRIRTQRLLEGLEFPQEISSPAGLSIGAEGPEEIAISIVAELIQQQRSKRRQKVITFER